MQKLNAQLPAYGIDPHDAIDRGDKTDSARLPWATVTTSGLLALLSEICGGHRVNEDVKGRCIQYLSEACECLDYLKLVDRTRKLTANDGVHNFEVGYNGIVHGWSLVFRQPSMKPFTDFWRHLQEDQLFGAFTSRGSGRPRTGGGRRWGIILLFNFILWMAGGLGTLLQTDLRRPQLHDVLAFGSLLVAGKGPRVDYPAALRRRGKAFGVVHVVGRGSVGEGNSFVAFLAHSIGKEPQANPPPANPSTSFSQPPKVLAAWNAILLTIVSPLIDLYITGVYCQQHDVLSEMPPVLRWDRPGKRGRSSMLDPDTSFSILQRARDTHIHNVKLILEAKGVPIRK